MDTGIARNSNYWGQKLAEDGHKNFRMIMCKTNLKNKLYYLHNLKG